LPRRKNLRRASPDLSDLVLDEKTAGFLEWLRIKHVQEPLVFTMEGRSELAKKFGTEPHAIRQMLKTLARRGLCEITWRGPNAVVTSVAPMKGPQPTVSTSPLSSMEKLIMFIEAQIRAANLRLGEMDTLRVRRDSFQEVLDEIMKPKHGS